MLEIVTHPQSKTVWLGSSLSLTCLSSLSSNVMFSWTHNGTTIRQPSPINGTDSRLTISNVSFSDGGSYVCIVMSGSLSVTSNTATVTVRGKLNCMSTVMHLSLHCSFFSTND